MNPALGVKNKKGLLKKKPPDDNPELYLKSHSEESRQNRGDEESKGGASNTHIIPTTPRPFATLRVTQALSGQSHNLIKSAVFSAYLSNPLATKSSAVRMEPPAAPLTVL